MAVQLKRKLFQMSLLTAAICAPALGHAAGDWAPTKTVEFYVPCGAGGGTDQFARLVQTIIIKHKLMDQNTVVINKAGGSGAESFVEIASDRGNSHKIVFGTNNAYLLPLVVRLPYRFDQLTPVAMLAQDEFLLWVPQDAPYKTARDFIGAARANPANFVMGGAHSKDTDQTLAELINKTGGMKLTYVPIKSGAEAATQLAGKHVAANLNNPNENISQWRAGQVRPLCVFGKERMPYKDKVTASMSWNDIPTCVESGLAISEYRMPRAVYIAAGTTPEQVNYYVRLLRKVSETPEWKAYLQTNALNGDFANGEELKRYIENNQSTVREIFVNAGWLVK
ncbi:tricarboxylate transporter [Massilia sp. WF1]|uniref:Bug family tripartite tricarboxylate transporter substrate binding protein n=1 Tax=unclassified Massilia TaxID=2609279 RepID=UPI000649D860|nr:MULTISPECIES: tripartite tricarboxylate transporter substrate binding protein [unclassified Massilia]ALK97573.1 tricarboxylate transporter [Massilia sp. WG5]KLU35970.1 tricarboxylate transporter [Massilia sp. WF1]